MKRYAQHAARDAKNDLGRRLKFAASLEKLLSGPNRPTDVRVVALAALPSVAGPSETLEILQQIEMQESRDPRLIAAMAGSVEKISLESLDKETRSAALRQVVTLLRESKDEEIIAACVRQLANYRVDMLCGWLMTAFRVIHQKNAAGESIIPYCDALLKRENQRRVDEIGDWVQSQLVETVEKRPAGENVASFELEYLIQSIGLLQNRRAAAYEKALPAVAKLLREWRDNRDCLDTVINSYVELRLRSSAADASTRLGEVLRNREAGRFARIAAAEALGRLYLLDGADDLIATAKNGDVDSSVRVAAVHGLAQIGDKSQRDGRDFKKIKVALEEILERKDPHAAFDRDVVEAALRDFVRLGGADRAKVMFPWMRTVELNVPASEAVSTMIQGTPADAPRIVTDFLVWLAETATEPAPHPPEAAITEMDSLAPALPAEVKAKAREAVVRTLDDLRRQHPNLQVRELAAMCLENLQRPHDGAEKGVAPPQPH